MLAQQQTIEVVTPSREAIALALFDGAADTYQLSPKHRHLLKLAARYYAHVRELGVEKPTRVGRDLVLAQPLEGLDAEESCVVACVVAFQGERLKRDQELGFLRLNDHDRRVALRLAAALSLADALAANGAQMTVHQPAPGHHGELTLVIGGNRAALAAEAVSERDWRWVEAFGPLTVRTAAPDEVIPPLPEVESDDVQIAEQKSGPIGEQDFAEHARRTLRRHFEKMLARETDVRSGEDPEDVHQMRVATRRLRASLQVVAPVFDEDTIKRFRRKLRATAEALGHVRDADVFLEHLRAYRNTLPAPRKASLDVLIERVAHERSAARAELLAELETKRYQRFKHEFASFLTTPGDAVVMRSEHGGPIRVRDMAGSLIWRRYENLRSFEVVLPDGSDHLLHQARISGKRLRYTLEFFAEALGDGVNQCLEPLAELQELLGGLQDSVVAHERIRQLGMENAPGPRAYLARRAAERSRLLRQLPKRWDRIERPAYQRRLFELFSAL